MRGEAESDVSADVADFYWRNPLDPLELLGPGESRKPGVGEHSSQGGAGRRLWEEHGPHWITRRRPEGLAADHVVQSPTSTAEPGGGGKETAVRSLASCPMGFVIE